MLKHSWQHHMLQRQGLSCPQAASHKVDIPLAQAHPGAGLELVRASVGCWPSSAHAAAGKQELLSGWLPNAPNCHCRTLASMAESW